MNDSESIAAIATIHWVSEKDYRRPWLRYNPQLFVADVPELNMRTATWDIVVRLVNDCDDKSCLCKITFQFASRSAPHSLLTTGLEFNLCEGPGVCVWKGTIEKTYLAPRDPKYWYADDGNQS